MYAGDSENNQNILDELNTKSVLTETLGYRRGIGLHWQSAERQTPQMNNGIQIE
jgi:hypothetical protein